MKTHVMNMTSPRTVTLIICSVNFYKWCKIQKNKKDQLLYHLCFWMTSDGLHGFSLTDSVTDRPTDWLTTWLTDGLTDWLMAWLTDWRTNWLTDGLTDWRTDWQTDRLTDWLNDALTDWRTYWLTDRLTDWLTQWSTDGRTDQQKDRRNVWVNESWIKDLMWCMKEGPRIRTRIDGQTKTRRIVDWREMINTPNICQGHQKKKLNLPSWLFSLAFSSNFFRPLCFSSSSSLSRQRWKFSTTTPTIMLRTRKPPNIRKGMKYASLHSR